LFCSWGAFGLGIAFVLPTSSFFLKKSNGISSVAYPPGLLKEERWRKIMTLLFLKEPYYKLYNPFDNPSDATQDSPT